ncbi:MAG: tRNA (N(6)-L-threonylcarbamoyladenosine(37)-C(2))-methylthiotransferase MtaB [Desulfobacterales bacterium]|nr:tRNA (N(6)-L-threonylcarbamoyladenosine(37)-C(2))-methylthiotransferase MtaB [Desulfobacterales bacterium]
MATYKITTFGCKVNQCESDSICSCMNLPGWSSADKNETADIFIINTCTVTQKASMQSRQAIRQAIRENPDAKVIVTGCYAQVNPEEIEAIKGVDVVIGQSDKHTIPEILAALEESGSEIKKHNITSIENETAFSPLTISRTGNRTRFFLKVQDGCNSFCTYCIVPYARGRVRSMMPEEVMRNLEILDSEGFNEVVLTGVHLGRYGSDLEPQKSLLDLLKEIDALSGIHRFRLSSIEPKELSEEIIELVSLSNKFCRHFHIPLQSGDNHILKQMKRPYSRDYFKKLVLNIDKKIPDIAIGADVLVGFPGETDTEFNNTYALIESLPVSYLHVFPFSPRKGTPAASFPGQVHSKTIKERCRLIRRLGLKKKERFYSRFIGKTLNVLVEGAVKSSPGMMKGLTSNYLTVYIETNKFIKNTVVPVKITQKLNPHTLLGELPANGKGTNL